MKPLNTIRTLRTVVQAVAVALLTFVVGAGAAFAQNTIYVDATNGADIRNGQTRANAVATIEKGIELLPDTGGTLVIRGDDYALAGDLTINKSFTVEFEAGEKPFSYLTTAGGGDLALTFNSAGGTTFKSVGGSYGLLKGKAGDATDIAINGNGNVTLDAATTLRMEAVGGDTDHSFVMSAKGKFVGAAPQVTAGQNINLEYTDAADPDTDAYTSGAEAAQYTDLGDGTVTINYSDVKDTFTYTAAIKTTGAITKTDGPTTFQGNVTAASFTSALDTDNFGSDSLTTTGNVTLGGAMTVGTLTVGGNLETFIHNLTASGDVSVSGTTNTLSGTISVTGNFTSTGAFTKLSGTLTFKKNATFTAGATLTAGTNTVTDTLKIDAATTQAAGSTTAGALTANGNFSVSGGSLTVSGLTTVNGVEVENLGAGKIDLANVAMTGVAASKLRLTNLATGSYEMDNVTITVPDAQAGPLNLTPFESFAAGSGSSYKVGDVTMTTDDPDANATITMNIVNGNGPADAAKMTFGNFSFNTVVDNDGLPAGDPNGTHTYQLGNVDNEGVADMTIGTAVAGKDPIVMVGDMSNDKTGTLRTGLIGSLTGNITNAGVDSLFTSVTTMTGNVTNNAEGYMEFSGAVTGNISNDNAFSTMVLNAATSATGVLTNAGKGTGRGGLGNGLFLNANLTLSGDVAHDFVDGDVKGGSKIIFTNAGLASLNAGSSNFGDIDFNGAGVLTLGGAPGVEFTAGTVTIAGFVVVGLGSTLDASSVSMTKGGLGINAGSEVVTDSFNMASGTLNVIGGVLDVGSFTQNGGTATFDGNSSHEVSGDFTRTVGTYTMDAAGASLVFDGVAAQSVKPGTQLLVHDLINDNAVAPVTIESSLRSNGTLTLNDLSNTVFGSAANLIMIGIGESIVNNSSYTTNSSVSGIYVGGVFGTGVPIVVGGTVLPVFTLEGQGTYGNLFVSVGDGNDLTYVGRPGIETVSQFTDALHLISGEFIINDARADWNPVGPNAKIVQYFSDVVGAGSQGMTIPATAGSFNFTNQPYDIEYTGSLGNNSTDVTVLGNIHTVNTRNVTIDVASDGTNSILLPDAERTINGNLTITERTTVESAATADQVITVTDTLTMAGTLNDGNTGAAVQSIKLTGAGKAHSLSGSTRDGANNNDLKIVLSGANSSLNAGGTPDNAVTLGVVDINIDVDADNVTINGVKVLSEDLTVGAGSAGALTLNLVDRDGPAPAPETTGLLSGNVNITNGSLTLGTDVDADGTLAVAAAGTVNFGDKNYVSESAGTMLRANVASTFESTGGAFVMGAAGSVDLNNATMPYLTVNSAGNLTSDATIGNTLDLNSILGGAFTITMANASTLDMSANTTNNVTFADSGTLNLNNAIRSVAWLTKSGAGTVTVTDDAVQLIASMFTHYAGELAIGDNTLSVTGHVATDDGKLTMSTGKLQLVGGLATVATNAKSYSVKNLAVISPGSVTITPNSELQVGETLTLQAGFVIEDDNGTPANTSDDGELVFGDGATITRSGGSTITSEARFGSSVNLVYNGILTTSGEAPSASSVVSNVTLNPGSNVTLGKNMTVNGTLTMSGNLDDGVNTLTLADGATVVMSGGTMTASPVAAGQYNVSYTVAGGMGNEVLAGSNSDIVIDNGTNGAITVTANVPQINASSITVGENDVFDLNGNALNATGDLNFAEGNANFFAGSLTFSGAAAQTMAFKTTSPLGRYPMNNLTINNGAGVSVTGGDLSVQTLLDLTNGVLNMDGNDVELTQSEAAGKPVQGYTRENIAAGNQSHVANGTVTKRIPHDEFLSVTRSNVEFPVGTENPSYRGLKFFFTNTQGFDDLDATIDLTVGHVDTSAVGKGGLNEIGVGKYPPFYWTVESDLDVREGTTYELHAEAAGYDGSNLSIDDVKMIYRSAGDPDRNDWRSMSDEYDNDIADDNSPRVRAKNASGSIRATQQLFAFGLPADIVYAPIAAQELTVGGAVVTVADLDNVFTSNSPLTFALCGVPDAVNAVIDGDNKLSINGLAATEGAVTVCVEADDDFNAIQGEISVKVNAAPTVGSEVADITITMTQVPAVVDLSGVFTGGTVNYSFASVSADVAVATVADGASDVTLTPVAVGDAEVTVTMTDANGVDATDTFTVTVVEATTLSAAIADQEMTVGGNAVDLDLASAFAGGYGPYTYTGAAVDAAVGTATEDAGTLTLAAVAVGSTDVQYSATDANGVSANGTFTLKVNAAPTATAIADFTIDVIDAPAVFTSGTDFTFAGGTGAITITGAASSDEAVATVVFDDVAGTVTVDGVGVGTAEVTVTGTDANGASVTTAATTVTVIADLTVPTWDAGGALSDILPLTLNVGEAFTFDYDATSADGNDVVYAFFGTIPAGAVIDEDTGVLTWTPENDGDYVIRIQAMNSADRSLLTQDEAEVTVKQPLAWTAELASQTIQTSDTVSFQYIAASSSEGVNIVSYTLADDYDGAASIDNDGNFTFTVGIENPGTYDIDVTALDDRGFTLESSITLTVEMRIPFGDASGNGSLSTIDAVEILRYVVGLPGADITGDEFYVADVSGNGVVNTVDAALILRKLVDDEYVFPVEGGAGKALVGDATLGWDLTENADESNMVVKLGLKENVSGVNAVTYTVSYDAASVKIGSVENTLPDGWMISHYDDEQGTLKFAMIGLNAINNPSELVTVSFEMLNGAAMVNPITAIGSINDNTAQELDELELKVVPSEFALSQNYPNPFNPTTNINYQLPVESMVNITVYNMVGQKVATLVNEVKPAGVHIVNLDMSSFSSGSYIYRITADGFSSTKTMMLIK